MKRFFLALGLESHPVSHAERLVSVLGALVGMAVVIFVTGYFLSGQGKVLLVGSIGASAVLLFAVPHGALSQPWPLLAGHTLAALIGVSCAKLLPGPWVAAPLAVALTVAAMHYLRCIHPPGGATALVAVIGGADIQALGYQFVLTPVLVNVALLLCAAIAFNALFHWRRYPAYLARRRQRQAAPQPYGPISHEDFVYALTQIDSFIDVSEEDLMRIYDLATKRSRSAA